MSRALRILPKSRLLGSSENKLLRTARKHILPITSNVLKIIKCDVGSFFQLCPKATAGYEPYLGMEISFQNVYFHVGPIVGID